MSKVDAKLAERGLVLPAPLQLPEGMVLPFPEVNLRGTRAFISGTGPLNPDGSVAGPFGKVGTDVTVEEAAHLARLTGLAMIAGLKRTLGDLDRVSGWVHAFGMVNCAPEFSQQPTVINGFSNLILDVFGPEIGQHARSAVGMSSLPMQIAVEIEAEVEVRV
ncbi:RidA family protein [Aestuariivita sp.]|jgi:enamine deaminase RidA (YjgF/YER057c/UK114 family)|uniref:RidA family protein n=1 Tax=Aestuariivita sp. TaxID=1872407 RepID=UPI00216FF2D6|nr:RidA family protein [Aestuariivita sp.]MCE8009381.1 RidA family protein [Aestuariivita sp.]